uniref:Glycosyl transferase 64 domain-containing protein n=1 Tax=Ananas comosus var. bracteatus TaxID=296719 RepID=A0A6V7QCW9_ANACO|nr:unnamed protein product [Ananas comosus var. bracteatus]
MDRLVSAPHALALALAHAPPPSSPPTLLRSRCDSFFSSLILLHRLWALRDDSEDARNHRHCCRRTCPHRRRHHHPHHPKPSSTPRLWPPVSPSTAAPTAPLTPASSPATPSVTAQLPCAMTTSPSSRAPSLSFTLALFCSRSRPALVGFFDCAHDLDPARREWVYTSRHDRNSIILTKFLLLPGPLLRRYSCSRELGLARRVVDHGRNCKDILMSSVAAMDGAEVVLVEARGCGTGAIP